MTSERLHALDAVRGFAMLAGVVLHASMSFLPGYGVLGFPIPDRFPNLTLGVVYFVIHMSRMTTFFLIAGFFGHLLFHKLGTGGFARNRGVRIVIPFIVGWIILYPATSAAFLWATNDPSAASAATLAWPELTLRHFPLMHLWFLYFLIVIYAVSLGARAVLVGIDTSGAIRRRVDALMSALVHGPFLPIALAAPTAMVLVFLSPGWRRWFGVPPPDQSFVPTVPALVAYGSAFVLGWFLHRQTDLLNVWERRWPIHLAVAIAMTAISLSLVGVVPELEAAVRGPGLLVYAACYMVGGWAWTFAIVGTALRFFNQRSSVRRYLADASYWIYLMHLPVLFFLQAAVMDLHWHWSTKFLFVLMTTLAVSLASYHVLVRDTVLGVILNGRRHGRRGIQHAAVEVRPSIV